MAIIKCKMCGGDLTLVDGQSVAECEFCGSRQTVPAADNEKKLMLFGRANRLRANCDFDKAMVVYESIVADFPDEAEAYWGLVLCKYGIEYVDDPATGKKIPTCHRSSFDSILEDSDFEQAMENADPVALRVYREEAKQIEQIRRGILAVSSNEQPYDIFICYKETDENGDRTVDSVLAQDIYDALTDKGYRVFFSRISLEDKLGQAYEPYIFAALNSAKIMLVVGTCYEYYNAVWVKNEWSRFLKLISKDRSKALFPCYKNISPYDIPKEFAHLQGQDMGKIGAMQDLLRGVEKHLPSRTGASRAAQEPNWTEMPPKREHVQEPVSYSSSPEIQPVSSGPRGAMGTRSALGIFGAVAAAVIFFVWLMVGVVSPSRTYKEAMNYMSELNYEEAVYKFEQLGDYKDAPQQCQYARQMCLLLAGVPLTSDGYVTFGKYEQNNTDSAPETIEWIPLDVDSNRVLLVSRYVLDYMTYGDRTTSWKNSPARAWLNGTFLETAFTSVERQGILMTSNSNYDDYMAGAGKISYNTFLESTEDQVFLLDFTEVERYLMYMPERYTKATDYAKAKGAYVANNGNSWWAMRSSSMLFVGAESGYGETSVSGIRPAIWVDLDVLN